MQPLVWRAEEAEAVRDLMSDACRIRLRWGEGAEGRPRSVFYKRVVMAHGCWFLLDSFEVTLVKLSGGLSK